jgi:hypothetical protein
MRRGDVRWCLMPMRTRDTGHAARIVLLRRRCLRMPCCCAERKTHSEEWHTPCTFSGLRRRESRMSKGTFLSLRHRGLRAAWMSAVSIGLLAPFALQAQQGNGSERGGPPPARAQGIDAYLSQDALQVLYRRNMDIGDLGRNDVRAGFFINEDNDLVGIADMLVNVGRAERRNSAWSLQVGPRVYGALLSAENQDVFSIALGGTLSYRLGRDRSTSVSATAYYAPDITSFGNADSVADVSLEIQTPLTTKTKIYAGYRWFRFDLAPTDGISSDDREVDEGVHVGITYGF